MLFLEVHAIFFSLVRARLQISLCFQSLFKAKLTGYWLQSSHADTKEVNLSLGLNVTVIQLLCSAACEEHKLIAAHVGSFPYQTFFFQP